MKFRILCDKTRGKKSTKDSQDEEHADSRSESQAPSKNGAAP
jgi:hypothetical protein